MKETIKKYLEEQSKIDNAIKEAYSEEKLDGCLKYLYKQASKLPRGGQNGVAVEDEVVFKWVRDYILGDIAEEDKEKSKSTVAKNETVTEENSDTDEEEIIEETEELSEETKKAKKEVEQKSKGPELHQLSFDFGEDF